MAELEIIQNDREIEKIDDGVILIVKQKQLYPQKNVNNLVKKYRELLEASEDFINKFENYKKNISNYNFEFFKKIKEDHFNFIEKMKDKKNFKSKSEELLLAELQKRKDFIDKFDEIIKDTERQALEQAEIEKEDALKKIDDAKAVLELWEKYEVPEEVKEEEIAA